MSWYVQVQSQNYGPYSDEQMQGFAQEGRVGDSSLITNDVSAGFYRADAFDVFRFWQGQYQSAAITASGEVAGYAAQIPQSNTYETAQPQPHETILEPVYKPSSHTPKTPSSTISDTRSNIYLIMAEVKSDASMDFLQALQTFGNPQRIGDTAWLLRCHTPVEQLRNHLSQTLSPEDRLFILDSTNNKPAWFNIGTDLDHRIRELWDENEN